jgi:hypothetical protein
MAFVPDFWTAYVAKILFQEEIKYYYIKEKVPLKNY